MLASRSLHHLNEAQREAVLVESDVLVIAGPGSGKTETLTAKIEHLLTEVVPLTQGVAGLTYSNDAVREFSKRLRSRGHQSGRRLFLGTVHGFCLTQVIRTHARLAGRGDLVDSTVMSARERRSLLIELLDRNGLTDNAYYFDATLTRIRRAIACGEALDTFDERHIPLAHDWATALQERSRIDFEAMTLEALQLLTEHEAISDLVVARFPWLVIDEYQDLGGPLHLLVQALRDRGTRCFAVGDPDQCIMDFTGADPRYLNALGASAGVSTIVLPFNYRSGARLIAAAEAALSTPRGYLPDPARTDEGEIEIMEIGSELSHQANFVAGELVPNLITNGVPPHEIAILYTGKGPVVDAVLEALDSHCVPFVHERDERFPREEITRWLQAAARWSLSPWCAEVNLDGDLCRPLLQWRQKVGFSNDRLATGGELVTLLSATPEPDLGAVDWIRELVGALELDRLLGDNPDLEDDQAALDHLMNLPPPPEGPSVASFGQGVVVDGHVAVTTYHGSKGRQFDVILLPGLQSDILPSFYAKKSPAATAAARRLFYVGLTRARHRVALIYSSGYTKRPGWRIEGRSRFVDELQERLSSMT